MGLRLRLGELRGVAESILSVVTSCVPTFVDVADELGVGWGVMFGCELELELEGD